MQEEEFMAFLQEKPYLFYLVRNKKMMEVLKSLEEGGKTLEELSEKFGIQKKELEKILEDLVEHKTFAKIQAGTRWVYYLDFEGRKLIELYKKAKG